MAKTTKGRIEIPKNPGELQDLASKVYVKHQLEGDKSPLKLLVDHSWDITGPKVAQLLAKHAEAETAKAKMEAAYRERDLLHAEVDGTVRASAGMLKSINAKNVKRLGDWGFKVADTPPTSAKSDAVAAKNAAVKKSTSSADPSTFVDSADMSVEPT